jgi:enamidase
MSPPDLASGAPRSVGLINIGRLYTGNIDKPAADAEALHCVDGKLEAFGSNSDVKGKKPDRIIDAVGLTVMPGLIDCHVHPQIGDWTSRFKIADWIGGYGRAGVTTVISQGAAHLQGRPSDRLGAKLLAMFSAQAFANFRPDGVKVAAGTVMLEPGLVDSDFTEMWNAGVRYVAEIGISGISAPKDAAPMVRAARAVGMKISMHFGAPSIAGSRAMGYVDAMQIQPDIIAHVNGGSTGRSDEELISVIADTEAYIEACYHGGLRQMLLAANILAENRNLKRLIFGSDSPSAIGVTPQAVFRMMSWLASVTDIAVHDIVAAASGNAQRAFGLPSGTLAEGQPADLLVVDAPLGAVATDATKALQSGDVPAIALILQDGVAMPGRAYNCPFPNRNVIG